MQTRLMIILFCILPSHQAYSLDVLLYDNINHGVYKKLTKEAKRMFDEKRKLIKYPNACGVTKRAEDFREKYGKIALEFDIQQSMLQMS
jgi:hypothetical protein